MRVLGLGQKKEVGQGFKSQSTRKRSHPRPFFHILTPGASTAFVALSALASFSFVWRGAVRRRGEEAERRLCQLAALEDDPYVTR